jgi:RNA polymerase sigma-70 factor (ECF subfamily)
MSLPESAAPTSTEVERAVLVETAVARARARWGTLRATPDDLVRYVDGLGDRCGDLEQYGDELVLACACLQGDEQALMVLEREYIGRLGSSLVRFGTHDDFVAEVTQLVRERLLVPPEPRLAMYAATGPLLTWMRVVAVRLGLSRKRSVRPGQELLAEHLLDVPSVEASDLPRYRLAFDAAVRRVFGSLSLRERNLLRLHYLDGVSLDQLGRLYDVHRATAARWLADLRRRMLEEIEREVSHRLKLSASEFRSMAAMLMSRLDASLALLLRGPEPSS